jgi:hypothetical protein
MNKLLLLVGAGVGYVLGARAGRERYDQIADQANRLWTDPRVQTKVEDVKAKAPEVAHKVSEQAKAKVGEVKNRATGEGGVTDTLGGATDSLTGSGSSQNAAGSYDPLSGTTSVDTSGTPGGDRMP